MPQKPYSPVKDVRVIVTAVKVVWFMVALGGMGGCMAAASAEQQYRMNRILNEDRKTTRLLRVVENLADKEVREQLERSQEAALQQNVAVSTAMAVFYIISYICLHFAGEAVVRLARHLSAPVPVAALAVVPTQPTSTATQSPEAEARVEPARGLKGK